MPYALQHATPHWVEPWPAQPYPYDEPAREVIDGHQRIVHAKRARKLRKRGVPLIPVGRGKYAWYESEDSYKWRARERELRNPYTLIEAIQDLVKAFCAPCTPGGLIPSLLNAEARLSGALTPEAVAALESGLRDRGYHVEVLAATDEDIAARRAPMVRLYYIDEADAVMKAMDVARADDDPDIEVDE